MNVQNRKMTFATATMCTETQDLEFSVEYLMISGIRELAGHYNSIGSHCPLTSRESRFSDKVLPSTNTRSRFLRQILEVDFWVSSPAIPPSQTLASTRMHGPVHKRCSN